MLELLSNIDAEVVSAFLTSILGLVTVIAALFRQWRRRNAARQQSEQAAASETSAQRIRRLTAAMTEAAEAVEEIQSEIREKTTKRRSCERRLRNKSA